MAIPASQMEWTQPWILLWSTRMVPILGIMVAMVISLPHGPWTIEVILLISLVGPELKAGEGTETGLMIMLPPCHLLLAGKDISPHPTKLTVTVQTFILSINTDIQCCNLRK